MKENKYFCINLRPPHQAAELTQLLTEIGAKVFEFPTLEVSSADANVNIGKGWVAATSANAFRFLKDPQCLKDSKIAVIGGHTGMFAKQMGHDLAFVSEIAQSGPFGDSLGRYLSCIGVTNVTFLKGNNAGDDFQKAIEKYSIVCEGATVYKVKKIVKSQTELSQLTEFVDHVSPSSIVIFATSSLAIESFVESLHKISEEITKRVLGSARIIVIGPKTAEKAKKLGFRNVALSDEVSVEDMVQILLSHE